MLKTIAPNSYDYGESIAAVIKMAGNGRLRGNDRGLLEKRAGSEILHIFDQLSFAPGEVPIHLIAMGATEKFGCNRNGDGFREQVLLDFHKTFEKFARFYRDHANKDPARSFGLVKAAFYNVPMSRVELICALNATSEAARRNGGLLADRELEKLASGRDIPVSMACSVSHDICSYCGNKAKTRRDYCRGLDDGGLCKAGGLYRNIGRLVEVDGDAHSLHADNPDPRFFDISHVYRPADRIAYVLGRLEKSAADGVVSGAQLAEEIGLVLPYELRIADDVPADYAKLMKLAYCLADLETQAVDNRALAFDSNVHSGICELPSRVRASKVHVGQWLKASIDTRSLLPPDAFLHHFCRMTVKEAAEAAPFIRAQLPGIYGRLVKESEFAETVRRYSCEPTYMAPQWMIETMRKNASTLCMREPYLTHRVRLATIRGAELTTADDATATKLAAAGGPTADLARGYAIYKLAFLAGIPETSEEFSAARELVALQNLCG